MSDESEGEEKPENAEGSEEQPEEISFEGRMVHNSAPKNETGENSDKEDEAE